MIPTGAARVHGITTEIARQRGVQLAEVLSSLYADIETNGPELYIGHNVSFDRPIVLNEYARLGADENVSPLQTFCTMKSSTQICRIAHPSRGGYKWPTLGELHEHLFGHVHDAAHDAVGDVEATAKWFFELRRRGHA